MYMDDGFSSDNCNIQLMYFDTISRSGTGWVDAIILGSKETKICDQDHVKSLQQHNISILN